jgi:hypothetical protein
MSHLVWPYKPAQAVIQAFAVDGLFVLVTPSTVRLVEAVSASVLQEVALTLNVEAAALSAQKEHHVLCLTDRFLMFQLLEIHGGAATVRHVDSPHPLALSDRTAAGA